MVFKLGVSGKAKCRTCSCSASVYSAMVRLALYVLPSVSTPAGAAKVSHKLTVSPAGKNTVLWFWSGSTGSGTQHPPLRSSSLGQPIGNMRVWSGSEVALFAQTKPSRSTRNASAGSSAGRVTATRTLVFTCERKSTCIDSRSLPAAAMVAVSSCRLSACCCCSGRYASWRVMLSRRPS